ncbi:MAG: 4-hydroxy-3-methylbut-2-enyl diphosphate reductase [Dysgonamonadaceae bacterium]|jgi:4-hydroxy-3-methylbut-2-enyl diphosphate reductase|nr:4-hydroxy-3-methylbut-2-enyl diphosphate reductase [Dysgonamonadaceae bacterium]
MLTVEIDCNSGFCFGVVNVISSAEKELMQNKELVCLGDIVHNDQEVKRLQEKGLQTINYQQLPSFSGKKVLLRAHGEPPSTYQIAEANNIRIIDATCPVVIQLQKKIKKRYQSSVSDDVQIVIYGKLGHAEVNGLVGQTEGKAIVIEKIEDLDQLDYTKAISLFSQTTMSVADFQEIVKTIQARMKAGVAFTYLDSICRQVANRMPNIKRFATRHDLILFVAGQKSSNGKVLYNECLKVNPNTHLISTFEEIDPAWIRHVSSVGVCGATSTPKWLMEEIAEKVSEMSASPTSPSV